MGKVYVGTSGYSYKDWRGPFYPLELKPGDFMSYYSEHFPACEISYTYHRMPDALTLGHLVDKSQGRVQFIIKAHQDMTHSRSAVPSTYAAFREALQPVTSAGVLGGILAHYPYGFAPNKRNREYLKQIRAEFTNTPVIVELRNAQWLTDTNLRFLRRTGLSLCCVDEPALEGLLPASDVVSSSPAYVRFHGRNAERWWSHTDPTQRYDYRYSDEELQEWVPRIAGMADNADQVYVFLSNLFAGQAVENARRLTYLLEQDGLRCVLAPKAKEGTRAKVRSKGRNGKKVRPGRARSDSSRRKQNRRRDGAQNRSQSADGARKKKATKAGARGKPTGTRRKSPQRATS